MSWIVIRGETRIKLKLGEQGSSIAILGNGKLGVKLEQNEWASFVAPKTKMGLKRVVQSR
jgi:hypothetical protein